MASNFKILIHRNGGNVHMKLMGDFDGDSACELLSNIKRSSRCSSRVFIHTNCLKQIYPFGRSIFIKNFENNEENPISILFTGEKASQLAPKNPKSV